MLTCQLRNSSTIRFLSTKKDTSGGYCGGVPPLPIPNREVKPTCADGTAMQCGRVGSCLFLSERSFEQSNGRFFCLSSTPQFTRWYTMSNRAMWESRYPPPFTKHFEDSFLQSAFFVYIPCGPPATPFLKVLTLRAIKQNSKYFRIL